MKLKNSPKLEPGHLYLIKRDWDDEYLLVYPMYMNRTIPKVTGWRKQGGSVIPCFDDDIIIGSVERIEERKHVRKRTAEKAATSIHIKRDQVGVRLPIGELCECGNPECDGQGNYRPGTVKPAGTGDSGGYAAQPTKDIEI